MFQVRDSSIGRLKYAGRSKGKVLDNVDPLKRGRIIVDHPLLGKTTWIDYLNAPGMFSVPKIGDLVYVEADSGYETHPIAWGNATTGSDTSPNIPDAFQRLDPSNRGFYTPGGHLIELDDGEGLAGTGQGVRITTSGGNLITVLEDKTAAGGLITVETSGGAKVEIDGTSDKITAETTLGAKIQMDSSGIDIKDSVGNEVAMTSSGIKAKEVLGGELHLSTGKVALGGNTAELLDLFNQDLEAFINNASTIATTVVGPAVLNPVVVTLLTNIQLLLTTIKGSL